MFDRERMQRAREQRELSQSQLARMIQGKQSQVAAYEGGDRIPRADTLGRIAQSLQVSADWLLGLVNEPNGHVTVLSSQERALLDIIEKGVSFEAIQALASFLKGHDE